MAAAHGAKLTGRPTEPPADCRACARLAAFRDDNRTKYPGYFNGPVPSFGSLSARLLVVGLAPGLHGANQTGRPFTGDYAGDLLYATLLRFGFAAGHYGATPGDGLTLIDTCITNAVRCVPPQNKPVGAEVSTCGTFLAATLHAMDRLRVVVALGAVAHRAITRALGMPAAAYPFGHGARHPAPSDRVLLDSYHCSRYNTNTGRLTPAMFEAVFADARSLLDQASTSGAAPRKPVATT